MKRRFIAVCVSVVGAAGLAQAHTVTFQVDMSEVATVSPTVSVAGDFQVAAGYSANWTPGTTIMTDPDLDQIYTVTVDLPAGYYAFKYINGTAWGQDEGVPADCAEEGNRHFIVIRDQVLVPVCFGSCTRCPLSGPEVSVTLQVDLGHETVPGVVSVAGSFQNQVTNQSWSDWTPGQALLTDPDGDDVYSISFALPEGTYEYKFLNGSTWGTDEGVPAGCSVNGNRALEVVAPGPVVPPTPCFASCFPCEGSCARPIPIACDVTVSVTDTSIFASAIDLYPCSRWDESGPEVVFEFSVDRPGVDVVATLTNLSADLDVYLVDPAGCEVGQCLTGESYGDNEASAADLEPGTYGVVIDGFDGAAGSASLRLDCGGGIFFDDFELGNTGAWSTIVSS